MFILCVSAAKTNVDAKNYNIAIGCLNSQCTCFDTLNKDFLIMYEYVTSVLKSVTNLLDFEYLHVNL